MTTRHVAALRYTVHCRADDPAARDAYLAWLEDGHLARVTEAGALAAEVLRLEDPLAVDVVYTFASRAAFDAYERDHAPRLRAEPRPAGLTFTRSGSAMADRVARLTLDGPRVGIVPLLSDNYAYLLGFGDGNDVVVVDPSDGAPLLAALDRQGSVPCAIWCTHHHPDHVGGVPAILARYPGLPVYGSVYDQVNARIPGQTHGLAEGDEVETHGRAFRVFTVPGHTLGAVAYVGEGVAFTGDTLFLGGCGRVFEGTMAMMHASLRRLSALDPATELYVGHEYTEANLRFAAHVEPGNEAVHARLAAVRGARARGAFTVPGTLAAELATNPFLRAERAEVQAWAAARGEAATADDVFARVREGKNQFKG